jgi:signal transduction histidine kinase
MSIRRKIVLSHLAIIIIPCLLFTLAIAILVYAFAGQDMLNVEKYEKQAEMESKFFSSLKLMTTSDPEQLLEPQYLEKMNKEADKLNLYLVLRVNGSLYYVSPNIEHYPLGKFLAPFGEFKEYAHESVTISGQAFKYKQHDFYLTDKKEGSIFLFKKTSNIEDMMVKFHPWLLLLLLLILIGSIGTISYFVSKNIINPLITLKNATDKIKQGYLDFQIKTERKDEIGELFSSFEDMRRQLKNSIDLQLKYEENRKLLLSNISHDLKTPITSIKGYVEGIQDGIANSPRKVDQYMNTIYKKANELDALIDELFLFSKLDLKRIPFHFISLDIVSYIHDCVDELSLEYENQGIKIEFLHKESVPILVHADPEKLMRVFSNIIVNSVKYQDKTDPFVSISIKTHDDWVEIVIADNGPGISKEAIPYVFDQFYRADESRNSKTGGSGLGLAIAKQIIEEHEGKIWAKPDVPKGTEIHFSLRKVNE